MFLIVSLQYVWHPFHLADHSFRGVEPGLCGSNYVWSYLFTYPMVQSPSWEANRHLSLSWASPIQSIYPHPTSWRSILILTTHLHTNKIKLYLLVFNPLTPNDRYSGRTAPLTSKNFILYIYSTNTGTEYFKHGGYSPFFSLQNTVCFIILVYLVHVLFTFYIQDVLKCKKIIPAPKG